MPFAKTFDDTTIGTNLTDVLNIAARDALTGMSDGDFVKVLTNLVTYEYDGAAWQVQSLVTGASVNSAGLAAITEQEADQIVTVVDTGVNSSFRWDAIGVEWDEMGPAGGGGAFDINGLTEEVAPINGDFLPFFDLSAGANRKLDFLNLPGGGGGGMCGGAW